MTKFSSADVTSVAVVGSEGCQVGAMGCAPDGKWQRLRKLFVHYCTFSTCQSYATTNPMQRPLERPLGSFNWL